MAERRIPLERLRRATENLREYANLELGTDFATYGAWLRKSPEAYVRAIADYIFLVGDNASGRMLDACAGYGFETVVLGSLLSSRIDVIDIRPDHLSVLRRGLPLLDGRLSASAVDVRHGDVTDTPYEDEAFSWILCREAIEHICDLSGFFKEMRRILRHGGRLICTDDSSWLHRKTRTRIQEMWVRRDRDPEYLEELRRERPEDNASTRPFRDVRRDIIRSSFPHVEDSLLDELATDTMGLVREEIIESVKLHLGGKPMLAPDSKALGRDPVTKEFCERLLDPYEVREAACAEGFQAWLRPDSHTRLRWFLFHGVRMLNPLLLRIKPGFVLVARRP